MPHFLVIFTSRKITKATIMKVINATKKLPMPNTCSVSATLYVNVAKSPSPGIARPIIGMIKSLTNA